MRHSKLFFPNPCGGGALWAVNGGFPSSAGAKLRAQLPAAAPWLQNAVTVGGRSGGHLGGHDRDPQQCHGVVQQGVTRCCHPVQIWESFAKNNEKHGGSGPRGGMRQGTRQRTVGRAVQRGNRQFTSRRCVAMSRSCFKRNQL